MGGSDGEEPAFPYGNDKYTHEIIIVSMPPLRFNFKNSISKIASSSIVVRY